SREQLLLERQLVRFEGVLGGGSVSRNRVRGGSSICQGCDGGRLEEGVRSRSGCPARSRLPVRTVHAPLLRRIPWAASEHRTCRAPASSGRPFRPCLRATERRVL